MRCRCGVGVDGVRANDVHHYSDGVYRGTSLIRKSTLPYDHHRALCMGLL